MDKITLVYQWTESLQQLEIVHHHTVDFMLGLNVLLLLFSSTLSAVWLSM